MHVGLVGVGSFVCWQLLYLNVSFVYDLNITFSISTHTNPNIDV